jgi:hypothetical protein
MKGGCLGIEVVEGVMYVHTQGERFFATKVHAHQQPQDIHVI